MITEGEGVVAKKKTKKKRGPQTQEMEDTGRRGRAVGVADFAFFFSLPPSYPPLFHVPLSKKKQKKTHFLDKNKEGKYICIRGILRRVFHINDNFRRAPRQELQNNIHIIKKDFYFFHFILLFFIHPFFIWPLWPKCVHTR